MKEHPILFSGEMVRAILDGRKTQTRRVIVPQLEYVSVKGTSEPYCKMWLWAGKKSDKSYTTLYFLTQRCPYGQRGDRLWVRETFSLMCHQADPQCWCETDEQKKRNHYFEYKADTGNPYPGEWDADDARGYDDAPKWHPSIHMPRAASRIMLEIVGVRVQRLADISEDEAKAEGVNPSESEFGGFAEPHVICYMNLWNNINAKRGYGWDKNPWVWVIDFKRI